MTAPHAAATALVCVEAQAIQHAADAVIAAVAPEGPPPWGEPGQRLERILAAAAVFRAGRRQLAERLGLAPDAPLPHLSSALRDRARGGPAWARGVLKRTARRLDGMLWLDEIEPALAAWTAPPPASWTEPVCRICGCTDIAACVDDDGEPCHWVTDDVLLQLLAPAHPRDAAGAGGIRMSVAPDRRRRLLARIHATAKQRGVDEAARRELQERVTGVASCARMTDDQLQAVADALSGRPVPPPGVVQDRLPATALAGKLRALWIGAYHLGAVRDRSDRALCAFVRRQLRIDAAAWSQPVLGRAVEALKIWLARPVADGGGGVAWTGDRGTPATARADVLRAQWARLRDLGRVATPAEGALCSWVARTCGIGVRALEHLPPDVADAAIRALGERIRAALALQGERIVETLRAPRDHAAAGAEPFWEPSP